jgi:hypothetical protein
MILHLLVAVAVLCPFASARAAAPLLLRYEGSLHGVAVAEARMRLSEDDAGYTLRADIRTVGAFASLVHGGSSVVSEGVWRGGLAAPRHLDSAGKWNGQRRRMVVDFAADGVPVLRVLIPADPRTVARLAKADAVGSIDALSAVVGLMREVAATGGCGGAMRVFDGHGVTELTLTQASPQGAALRCGFTTSKPGSLGRGRSHQGTVTFAAPGPGMPRLPVRIVFDAGWAGEAVLALSDARVAPAP